MTARARIDAARPVALVGAAVGSATTVVALGRMGSGRLAAPPVHSWAALTRWYDTAPPQLALLAMLRCVALAMACWLCIAAALQVLGALPTLGAVRRVADAISPRSLQRLGHGLAGFSLTAGLAIVVPSAGIPLTPGGRSTALVAPDGHDPTASPATGEPSTASLRLVDDAGRAHRPGVDVVTVAVGDSLWSIAVDVLAERRGAPPSDRQVVPYWRRLIDENRMKLADPSNPDLIFPGQVFTLPPR